MGGLVELDGALGILAEHAVDDTDVKMEVRSTWIATMPSADGRAIRFRSPTRIRPRRMTSRSLIGLGFPART